MKKLLISTVLALAFLSAPALAGDYYGTRGDLPNENCRYLTQNNPHDAWANCPGSSVGLNMGGGVKSFCDYTKNYESAQCSSCGRDKKNS